jgi:hypothetical protein
MAEDKPKTEPAGQHSSDIERDPKVPATPGGEAPVFDDDSMFNSADRQSAFLSHKQSGKEGRKHTPEKIHEREKQRKAG